MGRVATSATHLFFLGILLVSLKRLDAAIEPCPALCHCTLEILNCSRTANPPGLHHVPIPEPFGHPYVFVLLDFSDNAISSISKQVWRAYPWTEYLILKNNHLSRLNNKSLDGLLSLTHLDVSCNQIQTIERNAFEPVPFLQFINLSGNLIERIMQGAFQAWHGMQFLFKLVLNHNPLRVIEDSSFYKLPSLKFLDLGSTEITPDILENLLKISLKLKTLILPRKMSCCLCRIQDDIEVLCKTVKLDCTNKCASNITQCEKEELLGSMQDEVMKVLETRKLNASSILSIVPEKLLHHNVTLSLLVTHGHSHLGIRFHKHNPHLFKSANQLSKLIPDEYVDVKWTDKNELEKLYKLANLLQVALKAKLAENEEETQEIQVQKELPIEVSEDSGDIILRTESHLKRAKSHLKRVKRNHWLGKNPRGKESFLRLLRKRREFAKATRQLVGEQGKLASRITAERWRKLARGLKPQRVASLSRLHRAALHSLQKRSIFHLPTKLPPLTASIVVDEGAEDLAGKVVIILKAANGSSKPSHVKHILISEQEKETGTQNGQNTENVLEKGLEPQVSGKENLLSHLIIGSKSRIPTDDSESLNELSPDITLSHETHWEHHEQTTSAPPSLDFLPATDDYLLQGDLFEAELNKRLASLIPNEPVRNLISHVIRILKMDCTEPTIQMACAKLISRTGLLMKLFSERENIQEASALWKSYFWPATNVANMTTPSSRKMQKPSDEIARQGIPQYGYGNKLLLAISVTAVIMVIIAVICLIEICSQRSAKGREGTPQERRTFLGRKKKGTPEKQTSASSFDKPLWLKDMYQPLDEIRKKDMIDKLHDEESSEEEDIFNWASARPPEVPEPLPVEKVELPPPPPTPAPSTAPSVAPAPAPAPAPEPVKKASSKKLSEKETPTTTESSPKAETSGTEEEGTEGTSKKVRKK